MTGSGLAIFVLRDNVSVVACIVPIKLMSGPSRRKKLAVDKQEIL